MKNRLGPVIAAVMLIIVIILILIIGKKVEQVLPSDEVQDLTEYYGLEKADEVAVIWNDELSDVKGKFYQGMIYLDFNTVHDQLNSRFYWDANEQILLYTTAKEIVRATCGNTEYYIGNDIVSERYPVVIEEDETIYLAMDFIKKYTDLEYELIENPNRLNLRTKWGERIFTKVKTPTQLRVSDSIKAPILQELTKGEDLIVISEEDEWIQAATNGIIGYVKKKMVDDRYPVTDTFEPRTEEISHQLMDEPVKLLWHQVTQRESNARVVNVLSNAKGVNVISPTWFYLNDNEGNLHDIASKDYVAYAHEQGVKVWGLFSNLENNEVDSTHVLTHTSVRENLVNQMISMALQYNLDGINVDFEALSGEVGDSYIQFIRELSLKCRDNGLVLSVDNYVPSEYTRFYNREEQAVFADYLIVMAYDEHYAGSDEGSVSSIGFVRDGVKNTLDANVPAEQLLLGLPFYTRIWEEKPKEEAGDSVEAAAEDYVGYELSSEAVGMAEARNRIEANGADIVWLEEMGQNYSQYEQGDITYKVWLEDAQSLEKKLRVATENQLGGVAFWKAGMETSDVWDVIANEIK